MKNTLIILFVYLSFAMGVIAQPGPIPGAGGGSTGNATYALTAGTATNLSPNNEINVGGFSMTNVNYIGIKRVLTAGPGNGLSERKFLTVPSLDGSWASCFEMSATLFNLGPSNAPGWDNSVFYMGFNGDADSRRDQNVKSCGLMIEPNHDTSGSPYASTASFQYWPSNGVSYRMPIQMIVNEPTTNSSTSTINIDCDSFYFKSLAGGSPVTYGYINGNTFNWYGNIALAKAQDTTTTLSIVNANSSANAMSSLVLGNNANANRAGIEMLSSGGTLTGIELPDTTLLYGKGTNGINIWAQTGPLRLWGNGFSTVVVSNAAVTITGTANVSGTLTATNGLTVGTNGGFKVDYSGNAIVTGTMTATGGFIGNAASATTASGGWPTTWAGSSITAGTITDRKSTRLN